MRLMYDAVDPTHIPDDAQIVAGYVDGKWPSFNGYDGIKSIRELFPHAEHVSIAVFADDDAQVLDVERYDARPGQAPAWAERQRKRGVEPTVYCSESIWHNVKHAFHSQNVEQPHYWIANYDGKAEIPSGAVAKQYENTPGYDVSVVADNWPSGHHHKSKRHTPGVTIHYVIAGETLSGIAEHYGVNWHHLYNRNRSVIGSNPDHIFPGQRLVIP